MLGTMTALAWIVPLAGSATVSAAPEPVPCVATMTPDLVVIGTGGTQTLTVTGLEANEDFTLVVTLQYQFVEDPVTLTADASGNYSATTPPTSPGFTHSDGVITGLTSGRTCTLSWDTTYAVTWDIRPTPDPAVLGDLVTVRATAGPCANLPVSWQLTHEGADVSAGQVDAVNGTFSLDFHPTAIGNYGVAVSCDAVNGSADVPFTVNPVTVTTAAPATTQAVAALPAFTG